MNEIELKRTPKGRRFTLESAINDLMKDYEEETGLEIQSVYFRREEFRSGVIKDRATISLFVQVPK